MYDLTCHKRTIHLAIFCNIVVLMRYVFYLFFYYKYIIIIIASFILSECIFLFIKQNKHNIMLFTTNVHISDISNYVEILTGICRRAFLKQTYIKQQDISVVSLFNHPHMLFQVIGVQKAQFKYRLDWSVAYVYLCQIYRAISAPEQVGHTRWIHSTVWTTR